MKKLFPIIALLAFSFSNIANAFGELPFAGTFIGNLNQDGIMYLVLVQTQSSVSGSLTSVYPDNSEGTGSHTYSLHGETDGKIVLLKDENFLVNGKKAGRNISLIFPNRSGMVSTITFVPGSEAEFNTLVNKLRNTRLSVIAANKEKDRLKQAEKDKLTKLADALQADVFAIQATSIKSNLDNAIHAADNAHSAIGELDAHLAELKQAASVRPMTCYQAYQTVRYGFEQTMGYDFSQTLGYASSNYEKSIRQLNERLDKVPGMVAKIGKDAQDLNQAIKISKFRLPRLSISPGEEQAPLKQYQELANLAQREIPNLQEKLEKEITKAKELMREGQTVMKTAQGLVSCK